MKKIIKLLILILLNISVYFIYNISKNTTYTILSLGDSMSLGINSYGIKDYSYTNYFKDYKEQYIKKVNLIDTYSKKDLTIENLTKEIQINNNLKKDLSNCDILLLNIGYNDIIYKLGIEESLTPNKFPPLINNIKSSYNKLLKEINKYYHKKIIVIGYPPSNKNDYFINKGIIYLNNALKEEKNTIYIDSYNTLKRKNKYFSNPNSYFPNTSGYHKIAIKLTKTLENHKNI